MPQPHASWHRRTLAVSAGRPPRSPGAAVNPPIVMSTTFHADGDVAYGRAGNPTWSALEDTVCAMEGGTGAVAVSSGIAAISLIVGLVPPGGTIIAPKHGYSGTRAALRAAQDAARVTVRWVDATDAPALASACTGADLVLIESPSNPLMNLTDIRHAVAAARRAGALSVVDNTFCTPLLQQPLQLGADAVVHSSTKFLGGHSDVLGGVIVTSGPDLLERLQHARELGGCAPSPMDAFLVLRGIRTLDVRLERAQQSASMLAERLVRRSDIVDVRYPGLPDHPQHGLATTQMSGPGAVLAVTLAGGAEPAEVAAASTRLWTHATSLGGVESLIERRRRWEFEDPDVPPGLLRLSVGIEDVEDLWTDLAQALDTASR